MIPPSQMLVSETLKIIEIPMVVDVMDARRPKMQENGRDKVIACDPMFTICIEGLMLGIMVSLKKESRICGWLTISCSRKQK